MSLQFVSFHPTNDGIVLVLRHYGSNYTPWLQTRPVIATRIYLARVLATVIIILDDHVDLMFERCHCRTPRCPLLFNV